ncbi:MAG: hypothetical protein AAF637_15555 [Pseudomonadota bacterium]
MSASDECVAALQPRGEPCADQEVQVAAYGDWRNRTSAKGAQPASDVVGSQRMLAMAEDLKHGTASR